MAKTKVAPIKTLSIPKLELLGAQMLARLVKHLTTELELVPLETFCWTDSTVVLAWLNDHPSRWNTFVATKTSEILTSLPTARWSHVKSKQNPADIASRGIMPTELLDCQLWWHGPDWLTTNPDQWYEERRPYHTEIEKKRETSSFICQPLNVKPSDELMASYPNLTSLLLASRQTPSASPDALELSKARNELILTLQRDYYSTEIQRVKKNQKLSPRSHIRRLLPFLDFQGMLRVGGRLQNSYSAEVEKHPVIIPGNSVFARLLIKDAHDRTLHGGPQIVANVLQQEYWITRARVRIRSFTNSCETCSRHSGRTMVQQMGPFPAVRVTPARPFKYSGLDYAGSYMIRTTAGRGHKSYKGYIALFICMVTRAIHIEVVSDYTTRTFLQAFRRFVSRRSASSIVYSDNGKNFEGASNELRRLFDATIGIGQEIAEAVALDEIKWNFIPPRAPYFGGLWEAGVKSMKHHLRRAMGDLTLTFEELSTLTCEVEACLNSRPLSPLTSDPSDMAALTPGHFLVGRALTAFPEPCTYEELGSLTDRYKLVTQMRNYIWDRWRKDVLRRMQLRSKWLEPNRDIKVGDLVILTDELQLPAKWPLARIRECAPGKDGLILVIKLQTENGKVFERHIHQIIKLQPPEQLSPPLPTNAGLEDMLTAGG